MLPADGRMALDLGMASLGHVSLDGSKFKASSSKHKAMGYGRMRERALCGEIGALSERALEAREEALSPGREIEDGKQIGFADKDARIMGK